MRDMLTRSHFVSPQISARVFAAATPLSALVFATLALTTMGCSGSPGLTVTGSVEVETTGTPTGFVFEQPARLDGAAPNGAVTGSCSLTRNATGYGVVVDLFGPTQAEGRALRSISFLSRTDAPAGGSVEAELGADTFRGTCTVEVPFVNDHGQVHLRTTGCTVAAGSESATVTADLTFDRCTLMGE